VQAFRSFEQEIGGRKLTIETGLLARQADIAVTVHYGDTVVLVTLGVSKEPREGIDFLPLTVDYEERLYAAGKIPGGFIRREGRPSQDAVLSGRLADRTIRPLLPKTWRSEIQLIITVLSVDQQNDPDILGVIGCSAALSLSQVPFYGPVSAIRVGYINDEYVLNPTLAQVEDSLIDLVVASSKDAIVMVEAGAREADEEIVFKAIQLAHEANQNILRLQEQLQQECGKPKLTAPVAEISPQIVSAVDQVIGNRLDSLMTFAEKAPREQLLSDVEGDVLTKLGDTFTKEQLLVVFDKRIRTIIRSNLIQGKRAGGRDAKTIRPLSCQVGLLPRTHGSGLFTRGETQVLTITTLGSSGMEQQLDGLGIEESKRFIHHYNMPPFSTGEVKRIGTPGRREIGHGALAERALEPVIPKAEEFPYTIRLVSEVLSSSGSTSMASVCASSLSLMDAGIPIKRPVAGIATGLVTDEQNNYLILTDIEGLEDNYGDMDFKVAGTSEGITAIQMDTKLKGLTMEIVQKTIAQAKESRLFILGVMNQTINTNRSEMSPYAPRMYKLNIPTDKIGTVIGPGGKTIRAIIDQTKTTIDIKDDGTVVVGSPDEAAARKAIGIIEDLTRDVVVGTIYTGKVTRILPFGAVVEILPGKDGMVHISELADYRVATVEDEVHLGDEVTVKVLRVEDGKIALSRRAVLAKTAEPGIENISRENQPRQQRESRPFRPSGGSRPPQDRPRFRRNDSGST
jgi:polyribonucleotide nucleotidyltransferase